MWLKRKKQKRNQKNLKRLKERNLEKLVSLEKDKFSKVIFIVTAIGASITLINYVGPVINYANDLNGLVQQYEQINKSLERMDKHIDQYEQDRTNKKKSFSIGLVSSSIMSPRKYNNGHSQYPI